jgi:hypothetical protein
MSGGSASYDDRSVGNDPVICAVGFEPLVTGDAERDVWERVLLLLSGEADGGGVEQPASELGAAPDESTLANRTALHVEGIA